MITNQTFGILIDPSSIEIFISSAPLKRIKVKVVEQDDFRYEEMALGTKQKFRGKVIDYNINLGDFLTKANLYMMILGSYDIVIGMDCLESHDAMLNCNTIKLSLMDDLGQSRVIVGRN
jgi:hypothetical protein